jgi:hypothetical protein
LNQKNTFLTYTGSQKHKDLKKLKIAIAQAKKLSIGVVKYILELLK